MHNKRFRAGQAEKMLPVQTYVFHAPGEDKELKKEVNVLSKASWCNSKVRGGRNLQVLFIMQSIQREITGSSSESCTYIKDAPDSPSPRPLVAMEVAEM